MLFAKRLLAVKRLLVVLSAVATGSLALAVGAIAAGGGLPPGDYVFTSTSAYADIGTGKGIPGGQPSISVFVNRGLNSFQPENPKGPRTVTDSTMVSFSIFTATGGISGCWIVGDSDFTVSKSLQSASLHATLTADNVCPGLGSPVTGKGGAVPFAGGAGGDGIALPITLDVTWTGLGATAVEHDRGTFQCLDYSVDSTNVLHASNATASATVSGLAGSYSSDSAQVSSTDTHIDVNRVPQQACQGL